MAEKAKSKEGMGKSLSRELFQSDDESWKEDPAPGEGDAPPRARKSRKTTSEKGSGAGAQDSRAKKAGKDAVKDAEKDELKRKRQEWRNCIPEFEICAVEIYYERPAVGLKVPCNLLGKPETKTGLSLVRPA